MIFLDCAMKFLIIIPLIKIRNIINILRYSQIQFNVKELDKELLDKF